MTVLWFIAGIVVGVASVTVYAILAAASMSDDWEERTPIILREVGMLDVHENGVIALNCEPEPGLYTIVVSDE